MLTATHVRLVAEMVFALIGVAVWAAAGDWWAAILFAVGACCFAFALGVDLVANAPADWIPRDKR